jgi:hypothetical protein
MFCGNCGKELPNDANFCLKCGKPQGTTVQAEAPFWEMCEIYFFAKSKGLFSSVGYFWTEAIGPKGKYNAGQSESLIGTGVSVDVFDNVTEYGDTKKLHEALHKLIQRLTSEGWEPIPRGQYYFSYRFRRRTTSG